MDSLHSPIFNNNYIRLTITCDQSSRSGHPAGSVYLLMVFPDTPSSTTSSVTALDPSAFLTVVFVVVVFTPFLHHHKTYIILIVV